MTAILLIIGLILLFKFVLTSHAAANAPQGTSVVNTGSCGSAGDNFTSGSGIVAGVSEPTTPAVCTKALSLNCGGGAAPSSFNPPPLHITLPISPSPIVVRRPILTTLKPQPVLPGPIPKAPIHVTSVPVYRAPNYCSLQAISNKPYAPPYLPSCSTCGNWNV